MADTPRTLSALLALLADNTSRNISEQDLRDVLVSILGGYAEIYCNDASTAQTVNDTPQRMTGFTTNGPDSGCTADAANDKIVIDVAGDYLVSIAVAYAGTLSKTFEIYAAVGTTPSHIGFHRKLGTAGDVGAGSACGILTLAASDEVSAYVHSSDGGTSFTPQNAQLTVKRIG